MKDHRIKFYKFSRTFSGFSVFFIAPFSQNYITLGTPESSQNLHKNSGLSSGVLHRPSSGAYQGTSESHKHAPVTDIAPNFVEPSSSVPARFEAYQGTGANPSLALNPAPENPLGLGLHNVGTGPAPAPGSKPVCRPAQRPTNVVPTTRTQSPAAPGPSKDPYELVEYEEEVEEPNEQAPSKPTGQPPSKPISKTAAPSQSIGTYLTCSNPQPSPAIPAPRAPNPPVNPPGLGEYSQSGPAPPPPENPPPLTNEGPAPPGLVPPSASSIPPYLTAPESSSSNRLEVYSKPSSPSGHEPDLLSGTPPQQPQVQPSAPAQPAPAKTKKEKIISVPKGEKGAGEEVEYSYEDETEEDGYGTKSSGKSAGLDTNN